MTEVDKMSLKELIRRGNIVRTEPRPDAVGCYQANGMFGCVWSAFGLHAPAKSQTENPNAGRSHLMHMSHWGRFRFISDATGGETAADYLLPLLRLNWKDEPKKVTAYRQEQDFWSGMLTTSFTRENGTGSRMKSWFDFVEKNLLGLEIEQTGGGEEIILSAVTDFIPYPFLYKKKTAQSCSFSEQEKGWCIRVCCPDTENQLVSTLYLYTDSEVTVHTDGLHLGLREGMNRIFLSFGKECAPERMQNSTETTALAWEKLWEKSAWMDFPEERPQQMFVRSLAYLLATYSGEKEFIQPTNGMTGNMFPFHFVQDMEYIAPALLMTGHVEIVKNWVEKFARQIPELRSYAKQLWPEAEGICPPWELPHGKMEGYHSPSMPVVFCYEPHNTAYLCRMAAETAEHLHNDRWTQEFARPIVEECAKFYRAFADKRDDGRWHFKWYPSVGQDEAGGRNGEDYLCSLYSAKYCFTQAVKHGFSEYETYLKDGFAFEALQAENGVLHTQPGADDFGKQKHPIQLDGVTYMPSEEKPAPEEIKAYAFRKELTSRAKEPFYFGWTLGQFLLAGANLGDAAGYRSDWAELHSSDYVDEEWIQIYETSGETEKSFYLTTHGMVLQSMLRCVVNDYWGEILENFCPAFGDVKYGNIRIRV